MRNHFLFFGNVFAHLVASMSGVVSFCIAIWEAFKKKKIESRVFFIVGALFLLVACDQAWQDEHGNVKTLTVEKSALWQERDFWKSQSYDKDASLRIRDSLLLKNGTALADTQASLVTLSNKIIDINKPQAQKFLVRRDDSNTETFAKWKHYTQLVVMTNLPVAGRLLVVCDQPMPMLEAHILEGGPRFPESVLMVQNNAWLVRIPSPQITPQNPMIITIAYSEDTLGKCQTSPQ